MPGVVGVWLRSHSRYCHQGRACFLAGLEAGLHSGMVLLLQIGGKVSWDGGLPSWKERLRTSPLGEQWRAGLPPSVHVAMQLL